MTTPVAHRVCESTGKRLRDITTPPTSKLRPARNPIVTRRTGGTRLLSNEYLTKNTTPRNSASPPIHANPFTPTNCSQSIFGIGSGGGLKAGGDVVIGGGGGREALGWGAAAIGVGGVTGAGVTGAGVTVVGCAGRDDCDSTGCGDPFSSFSRATSDSSASRRWRTSFRRFFALTARAINQTGIPRTIKMTSVILFSTRHSTLLRALCTAKRTSTTTRTVLVDECLFYLPVSTRSVFCCSESGLIFPVQSLRAKRSADSRRLRKKTALSELGSSTRSNRMRIASAASAVSARRRLSLPRVDERRRTPRISCISRGPILASCARVRISALAVSSLGISAALSGRSRRKTIVPAT